MNRYSYTKNGFRFERIPKNKARAAYNNNLTVIFCPCNLRPGSAWGLEMDMNKANINCNNIEFEKLLNEFEYYNCNNETGLYTSFYIPVTSDEIGKTYNYKYLEV